MKTTPLENSQPENSHLLNPPLVNFPLENYHPENFHPEYSPPMFLNKFSLLSSLSMIFVKIIKIGIKKKL